VLAFIGWRAVDERQDQAASVAYVTSHGVTVKRSASGKAPPRELVEPAIERAPAFWCEKRPADCPKMRDALRGASLGFVDTETVHYAGRPSNMRGATAGRQMAVTQAHGDATTAALVTHECGHVLLSAAGEDPGPNGGERHHELMRLAGWGF
jgi:hypothetical protein